MDLIDYGASYIQSNVGDFLKLKNVLANIQLDSNPTYVSNANALMQQQIFLESQLPDILAKIEQVKAGDISVSPALIAYYYAMTKQIGDVDTLAVASGYKSAGPASFLPYIIIGGGLLVAFMLFKKR